MTALLTVDVASEADVFVARQRAREVAAALGLDGQDQVRVATAVSEVGRDVLAAGGGRVTFAAEPGGDLTVELRTSGAGTPPGSGMAAARRLVDDVAVRTDRSGQTLVVVTKTLPRSAAWSPAQVRAALASRTPTTPLRELQAQNAELSEALAQLEVKQDELVQLNAELEETNRGVVALYADLDEKGEQLQEANEAKTRFLANVSHELRTPVNSVLGLARLLLDPGAEPLSAEQTHQVGLVYSSAQDLLALVNELLDLAKAESGRLEAQVQPVDLHALWAELEGTLRPLVQPGTELIVEPCPPDVPDVVLLDPVLVRQVLRNLLTNAIKFTEAGSVRARTSVRDDALVIEVIDTGIGIAPADTQRVFEEFYQVRGPLQARSKGTGLGLPYTRRLVGILGGRLSLSSTPGQGSTFTVEFPLPTPARPDTPPQAPDEPHVALALLADDDPAFRAMLRQALTGLAGRVVEARDGEQAVAMLREHVPDVLFLDLRMPRLDGAGVLSVMHADAALAGVPVVVVTSVDVTTAVRARLASAVATLSKTDLTRESVVQALDRATGATGASSATEATAASAVTATEARSR